MPIEAGNVYVLGNRPRDYMKVLVISVKVLNKDRVVVYKDMDEIGERHITTYSVFCNNVNVKKTEDIWNEEKEE